MPDLAINEPAPFEFHAPTSIEDALGTAARHPGNFAYLAGGCDLLDMMKRQWNTAEHVIDLKRIQGLRGIVREKDRVMIGALTKLAELQESDMGAELYGLKQAAARVASPQIRNMGTAAGNLLQDSRCPYYRGPFFCYRHGGIVCDAHHGINREHAILGGDRCYTVSPSDLAPVVLALDAVIHVRDVQGERTMPAEQLFVPPGENITTLHRIQNGPILTGIEIRLRGGNRRSMFIKDTVRNAWDFARSSVAITLELNQGRARNVRVVLGAVAAIPWRSRAAEQVLEGEALSPQVISAAAHSATSGAAPLKYNEYKVGLTQALIHDALTAISS